VFLQRRAGSHRDELVQSIRGAVENHGGRWISQRQFPAESGFKNSDVFRCFSSWSEAVAATGLDIAPDNLKIPHDDLLADWGELVRHRREIPTRKQYRIDGSYSPGAFERNFGPWSTIPARFREFAQDKPEWADVLALLPLADSDANHRRQRSETAVPSSGRLVMGRHQTLPNRPTYGDPMDFRGLRHAPVNENGVVFLFGMVAKELGYLVEAVQIGFPDCEAKRQIGPGKWQRVRIEFEFESRNFQEHGHSPDGCDVLVCWRHNWHDAPPRLEIVELETVINNLARSEE
jgi:hypothetical protein